MNRIKTYNLNILYTWTYIINLKNFKNIESLHKSVILFLDNCLVTCLRSKVFHYSSSVPSTLELLNVNSFSTFSLLTLPVLPTILLFWKFILVKLLRRQLSNKVVVYERRTRFSILKLVISFQKWVSSNELVVLLYL